MVKSLSYYAGEMRYQFSRSVAAVGGKTTQLGVKGLLGGGAASIGARFSAPFREALGFGGSASAIGQSAVTLGDVVASAGGGLATVGVSAGVYGVLNHMEYRNSERRLMELYRPQIASILGIEPKAVGVAHLYDVALENPSLEQELLNYRAERNIKNTAAIGSTLFAFAAVFAAISFVPAIGAMAAAATAAGIFSMAGLAFAGAAGAISFTALKVGRKVIEKVGSKMKGLDTPTVEAKVTELSKTRRDERSVSQEQVLGVFIAADPELGTAIEDAMGKPYHKLEKPQQEAATTMFGANYDVAGVTAAINEGRMNVRELTFAVHGQESGVYPKDPFHERIKDGMQDRLQDIGERLDPVQERMSGAVDKFQDWREERKLNKIQDKVAKAIEEGRPIPKEAMQQLAPSASKKWQDTVAAQRAEPTGPVIPARQ